jgi:tRNA 2-selenouridine synthase
MAHRQIEVEEFLRLGAKHPILDVRSPSEYGHAHIPDAVSFPLFSDEERAIVGTLYKQTGREAAVEKGLEFFGPRLNIYLRDAAQIIKQRKVERVEGTKQSTLLVHCWRGGMRSAGIAWLLDLYGYEVLTLRGGYKAYRQWVLAQFEKDWNVRCIGGYTGSGKTELLGNMGNLGCHVIDLEHLARHKGSAFGGIGQTDRQPTQEMFENRLAKDLNKGNTHQGLDRSSGRIWIEDESQRIGTVNIPQPFWEQMRAKGVVFIDIPFEKRLSYIVEEYGTLDRSLLLAAISRLQKKLGGLETKNAIGYLLDNDIKNCFYILLKYYDKLYMKALEKRKERQSFFEMLRVHDESAIDLSKQIIEKYGNG